MLVLKRLTLLLLLSLTFFPPFLECWEPAGASRERMRVFRAGKATTKYMDEQWEAAYEASHKWGNQRYTLTLYMPGYPRLHGMIVSHHNGLVTAFPDIEVKCPSKKLFKPCPRSEHTRTVFHGQLRPSIGLRQQQVLYASKHGHLRMTKKWVNGLPDDAVSAEHGWTWHSVPLPFGNESTTYCHWNNPLYDCSAPTGFFTYWLPWHPSWTSESPFNERPPPYWSGVFACTGVSGGSDGKLDDSKDVDPSFRDAFSVVVMSPLVEQKDVGGCVMVDGLATVPYHGPDPPVYEYL